MIARRNSQSTSTNETQPVSFISALILSFFLPTLVHAQSRSIASPWSLIDVSALPYMANTATSQGKYQQAEEILLEALRRHGESKALTEIERTKELARIHVEFGFLYRESQRYEESEKKLLEAILILNRLNSSHAHAADLEITTAMNYLGVLYRRQERFGDSERVMVEAIALQRRMVSEGIGGSRNNLAFLLNNLGNLYRDTHRYVKAEEAYLESIEIKRQLAQAEEQTSNRTALKSSLSATLKLLAEMNEQIDKPAEAIGWREEGLKRRREITQRFPTKENQAAYGEELLEWASRLLSAPDYPAAELSYREAYDLWKNLAAQDASGKFSSGYFFAISGLTSALFEQGKQDETGLLVGEGTELGRELWRSSPNIYRKPLFALLSKALALRENQDPSMLCKLGYQLKETATSEAEMDFADRILGRCQNVPARF